MFFINYNLKKIKIMINDLYLCAYTKCSCTHTNVMQYINYVNINPKKNDIVNNFWVLNHELADNIEFEKIK